MFYMNPESEWIFKFRTGKQWTSEPTIPILTPSYYFDAGIKP
jgi:hypothetical protein